MLARSISLAEIQAYTVLRGSRLPPEDKKRVLVESGAERGSALEMSKVEAAIRMLGSSFFQEYTSGKREKNLKTYDHSAFAVEETFEESEPTMMMSGEEILDDAFLESLAADDEDAALVLQFEGAIVDSVQEHAELSAFFSSYQEARKRLLEKTRARGFWPTGKGKGKKGSWKGKGKGPRKSLAQRIAESECKICHMRGHWKAECPNRHAAVQEPGKSQQVPVSFAMAIPAEVVDIPEMIEATWQELDASFCFGVVSLNQKSLSLRLKERLCSHMPRKPISNPKPENPCRSEAETVPDCDAESSPMMLFASSGTVGVVDLGASQSVIGSKQVPELLSNLPQHIRKSVRRTACSLVFRFGNHQTLQSKVALLLPLQGSWFRVAVVEGQTPFLLSSQFLKKTLKAVIDVDAGTLWSKILKRYLQIDENSKSLFLMDINQLWEHEKPTLQVQVQESTATQNLEKEVRQKELKQISRETAENSDQPNQFVNPQEHNVSEAVRSDLFSEGKSAVSVESSRKLTSRSTSPTQEATPSKISDCACVPDVSKSEPRGVHESSGGAPFLPPTFGGPGEVQDQLWGSTNGKDLLRGLQRPKVDSLVCEDLYTRIQRRSSIVSSFAMSH